MTIVDTFGYAAFVLDVIATWLFTRKHLWSWPCSLLSLAAWFVYGLLSDQKPILVSTMTFSVICLYGWWRWWKDEQQISELSSSGVGVDRGRDRTPDRDD